MPDLEQLIADWRKHMLSAGIKTPVPLEELESHLRDDIAQQMSKGRSLREAFDTASQRIGQPSALKTEFAKVGQRMSDLEHKVTWILCGVLVLGDVLLGLAVLLNMYPPVPLPLHERVLGATACFLFPVILWSWRFTYRYLPVIPSKGKRVLIGLLSCILSGGCTSLLMQFIPESTTDTLALSQAYMLGLVESMPEVAPDSGRLFGAIFWAFLPWVAGASLFFGLEEAAYHKLARAN